MKKICIAVFLITTFYDAIAQDSSSAKTHIRATKFTGQVMASYDADAFYVNFGGPSLSVNFGKLKLAISMLPSLRIKDDPVRPVVTPILGAGPSLQYKKMLLGFPFYYIAASNVWKMSVGLGYKF